MKTHTITTYDFNELSDAAKQTALNEVRDFNVNDSDWSEQAIEDAKYLGAMIGITIDKVLFSGFSSQGDGACFIGSYDYVKGGTSRLKKLGAPKDLELHAIADRLLEIQRSNRYSVSAQISDHTTNYYHENTVWIDVQGCAHEDDDDNTRKALRDFMRWIYKSLENEYDYLREDAQVEEAIGANDYQFREDGKIYSCNGS